MKKKICLIVTVALVVLLIGAVALESSLVNKKESCLGSWKTESGDVLFIDSDGKVYLGNSLFGEWEYSWFKLSVKTQEGKTLVFKIKSDTLITESLTLTKLKNPPLTPSTSAIFYSEGFFGYGEKGNFKYWSISHFAPIILFALAIFLFYRYREFFRNWKWEENFRFIFASAMLLVEMSYFWRLLYVGSSEPGASIDMLDKLPLQVCEWTCIFAVFMITKKSKAIYQVCFYVCMTIGVFPLLTPSVITTTGPAYYRYYQFWLEHILPPLAVLYMSFVHGHRPTKRGIIGGVCFMGTLTTFALICNANIPGANYLYLAEGTADGGGSIMDPIRNMVGGSTVALLFLLGAVVIGIFFLAFYINKWLVDFSEKKKIARINE